LAETGEGAGVAVPFPPAPAVEQHAAALLVDDVVLAGAQLLPAPGTAQRLQHVGPAAVGGVHRLLDLLPGLGEPVRGDRAADPQADAERFLAPGPWIFTAQHLAGADEGGCPLELLRGRS